MARLLLLFTLVPLLELFALLRIGDLIGVWPTVLLVIGTGIAGAAMARREGLRSWRAVQAELAAGRFPADELLHSLTILVAGTLLVTPGVFTDLAGLLLLLRPVRAGLIGRLRDRLAARVQRGVASAGGDGSFRFFWTGGGPGAGGAEGGEMPEWSRRAGSGGGDDATAPGAAGREEEASRRRPRVIEL